MQLVGYQAIVFAYFVVRLLCLWRNDACHVQRKDHFQHMLKTDKILKSA